VLFLFTVSFFVGELMVSRPPGELRMFVLGYTPWYLFFVAVVFLFIILKVD